MPTQAELQALWETATPGEIPQAAPTAQPTQEDLSALWETGTPMEITAAPGRLTPGVAPGAAPGGLPGGLPEDVPTEEALAITPQAEPERGIGEQLTGIGETALSALTGATGGSVGMLGGLIEGLYKSHKEGTLGTPEGVKDVERTAMQRAGQLTYEPRTEAGAEMAQELGELTAPMQALGPGVATAGRLPVKTARPRKPGYAPDVPEPDLTPEIPIKSAVKQLQKASSMGPGSRRAQKILAEMAAPDMDTVESAQRLGVDEFLQPDHITTNQQFREVAQLAKTMVGSEAKAIENQNLARLAGRADNLIDELGGTQDWSLMSSEVKGRLQSLESEYHANARKSFDEIAEAIPAKTDVATDNIISFIEDRIDAKKGIKNLSSVEKKLYKKLKATEDYTPSYLLLDDERKNLVLSRVKNAGPYMDQDNYLIQSLENQLLKDQKAIAEQYGMTETFDSAQRNSAIYKGAQNDLKSLFGKQLDRSLITPLQTGIKRLTKGEVESLKKTVEAIPEDQRQMVVATGLATALGKTSATGKTSWSNYANFWENLSRNKEAKAYLTKYLPEGSEQRLADLGRVADGIRKATNEYIPTGRGETLRASLESSDSFIKKVLLGAAAVPVAGAVEAVLPGAGAAMAIRQAMTPGKPKTRSSIDKLLASDKFRNLVNERIRDGKTNPKALKGLANSREFKDYIETNSIDIPYGSELWILDAMRPDETSE